MALDQTQIDEAVRLFYGEGLNLGEIAERIGCGLYDLSPWLYSSSTRAAWKHNNPEWKETPD